MMVTHHFELDPKEWVGGYEEVDAEKCYLGWNNRKYVSISKLSRQMSIE